jgi:hypothetical protein
VAFSTTKAVPRRLPAPAPAVAPLQPAIEDRASLPQAVSEPSGGRRLDDPTRAVMEESLGHSFANVRIHDDAEANAATTQFGTRALTVGTDILFGQGHFDPQTPSGRHLLAHELTHVSQNEVHGPATGRLVSAAGDRSETEAASAATALASGRPVGGPVAAPAALVQCEPPTPSNMAGGTLAAPPKPIKHRYERSGFRTGTGVGHFDQIEYNSETQVLTVTIRPKFIFSPFNPSFYPVEVREAAKGAYEAKKDVYITAFVRQAEAWGGNHVFHCHEPGHENLRATVRVEVSIVAEGPSTDTNITPVVVKDQQFRAHAGHSINTPIDEAVGQEYDATNNKMVPVPLGPKPDLRGLGEHGASPGGPPVLPEPKKEKAPQPVLTHEIGHIFGLDDEYVEGGNKGQPTNHSALAKSMLGVDVRKGDNPDSIMATGSEILPQHGVTFLEALRAITEMPWEFQPKATPK